MMKGRFSESISNFIEEKKTKKLTEKMSKTVEL